MTDITLRAEQHLDVPTGREPATHQLATWAQAADAAYRLAGTLCSTSFAPAAYRGKQEEATAAILAGAEVGLSPMASLRAFDNIQGTPAPKAITLRAIVQGQGHEVKVLESTAQQAVVAGRRKGDTDWQTSTWTLDRARDMGLLSKDQWKKQPAAMLIARATAEVCRWIAADALMGMPYTVEEYGDQGATADHRPAPRVVTAAEILGTDQPADDPADEPPITADEALDEIAQAATQTRLSEIADACVAAGINDQRVRDAWSARANQIANGEVGA